ncbi:MAG: hypothetical protein U0527_01070 [Candidatus Eisenbacteria bacterium]
MPDLVLGFGKMPIDLLGEELADGPVGGQLRRVVLLGVGVHGDLLVEWGHPSWRT